MTPTNFKSAFEFVAQIISDDLLPAVQNLGVSAPSVDISPILSNLLNIQNTLDTLSNSISVLKKQNYVTSTKATLTGLIPWDNTPPQITEGVQVMETYFAPSSDSSLLEIDCDINFKPVSSGYYTISVFVDDIPDCVFSNVAYFNTVTPIYYRRIRGTIFNTDLTEKRISVRIGGNASSTVYFNLDAYLGGTVKSSINITEFINV